ncbi:alkanesulfonate monooxygenase SsuD/methylene tetrahydromethanopterin reductase-like flavin-dependent oxidoreductase (luciferase family) [Amycolatopsis bartoniae]|uniref:Luciferase n=1 Tax=Amycolatopsis bartoniae TaxID=941986 RepID=A0A8H9J0W3_9PSEU|nr:LLM class flavin-dependent oxidoreductase [Amycolatopsis bartoniae]MBB2936389.1 alkanesulfonate monooxygenase SsuD/methylene tetrahydromethanopterin reductase-like flavin-dependent oxidoreductase (luciferase family) [Amycolatopsis bartoniae]TVS99191.1 LLM class flavin-dependent oxidoreductase [Amycolatopsis bartoniae]GHF89488.1 luciferase [Amycolatopsis bartoniae]
MSVGLGLPIARPEALLTWARRADEGPFTTLGLLDRLTYDNPEPLVTLATLAGATNRVRLQTEVLLAPLREPVLLAKQAATLDRLSGGRFTLGLGVGGRADEFDLVGADLRTRGRRLDEQMKILRDVWAGGPVGPAPAREGGPEVLFGAFAEAALDRVARWGDGFLCAAPIAWAGRLFDHVRTSWADAGRAGQPKMVAQVNVALGSESAVDEAKAAILDYYRFAGDLAAQNAERMLTTPAAIRQAVEEFTALGADEVMLYCWSPVPDQVHRLADAVGGSRVS